MGTNFTVVPRDGEDKVTHCVKEILNDGDGDGNGDKNSGDGDTFLSLIHI